MPKKKTIKPGNIDELCQTTAVAGEVLKFLGGYKLSFMEMRKVLKSADAIVDASIAMESYNYSLQKLLMWEPGG